MNGAAIDARSRRAYPRNIFRFSLSYDLVGCSSCWYQRMSEKAGKLNAVYYQHWNKQNNVQHNISRGKAC